MHSQHCATANQSCESAEVFLGSVEAACKERDLRLTPLRRKVLAFIAKSSKPVKAYELLQIVRPRDPSAAAGPPTVYRTLDFLLANGFIHRLNSINAFVPSRIEWRSAMSFAFFICEKCQSITAFETLQLLNVLQDTARESGFHPFVRPIEVVGICAQCLHANAPAKRGVD